MSVIYSGDYVETTVSEETFVSDDTIVGYKGELRFMDKNNYFLGSVGSVSAFRRDSKGNLQLAFVSTTNTDQGLNTTVSADDLRGGQGAPVITRFYHDVASEITLTDIMFKEAYIEAQLGTDFKSEGKAYFCETLDVQADGDKKIVTLSHTPAQIGFGCDTGNYAAVWYASEGKNNWVLADNGGQKPELAGNVLTINVAKLGANNPSRITVRYLATGLAGAMEAKIYANFVPEELFLVITTPLFAGDACAASNGKAAGSVQFEIPRFRLNGGQDFAAAMSSNQTINMSGAAMATVGGCDAEGAYLYKIIINYANETLEDLYTGLIADPESLKVGKMPLIYGYDGKEDANLIANDLLVFSPTLGTAGLVKTAYTVTPKDIASPVLSLTIPESEIKA